MINKQITEQIYSLETWHAQWKNLLYEAKLRLLKQAPIDAFTQKTSSKKISKRAGCRGGLIVL